MGQRNPAFDHHFHEIAKAALEPKIPSDTEDDDLSVEMAAFEKILNVRHSGSRPQKGCSRQICRPFAVCTTTMRPRKFETSQPKAIVARLNFGVQNPKFRIVPPAGLIALMV
jgi:hypothetical protein